MFKLAGCIAIIIAGICGWYVHDLLDARLIGPRVIVCIAVILLGLFAFLTVIKRLLPLMHDMKWLPIVDKTKWVDYFGVYFLLYVGTMLYVLASYYHLKVKNWSILKALIVAVPFVLCEYQFSLRGNYLANLVLKMNAVQILLITTVFCFTNAWIFNVLFLKVPIVWWREVGALILLGGAFVLTTTKN